MPPTAEPGSARTARKLWLVVLVLLGAIVYLQQATPSSLAKGAGKGGAGSTPAEIAPPHNDTLMIISRLALRLRKSAGSLPPTFQQSILDSADSMTGQARAAIVLNELEPRTRPGDAVLLRLVPKLQGPGAPPEAPALLQDIDLLQRLYAGGGAGALNDAEAEGLRRRHGFYGQLAACFGQPDTNPTRAALLDVPDWPLLLVGLMLIAGFVALVVGLVLAIYFLQSWRSGVHTPRLQPGEPGSLGVEILLVFMAAFLVLRLLTGLVGATSPQAGAWVGLLAQWLIVPVVLLYPRWRGIPSNQSRRFLGLGLAAAERVQVGRGVNAPPTFNRPPSVPGEIGAGMLGWLACLPFMAAGLALSLTLSFLWRVISPPAPGEPNGAPDNPLFDVVSGAANPIQLLLLLALATIWAPIVEETVFRGALFGHLRSRMNLVFAAILSGMVFGLMHGYPILMLGPVIGLGVGFAFIRTMRGSLIASMTAHCLHNSLVLLFLLVAVKALGL